MIVYTLNKYQNGLIVVQKLFIIQNMHRCNIASDPFLHATKALGHYYVTMEYASVELWYELCVTNQHNSKCLLALNIIQCF